MAMSDPEDRTMGGDEAATPSSSEPASEAPNKLPAAAPPPPGAVSEEGPGPVVSEDLSVEGSPAEDDLGAEDGATVAEDEMADDEDEFDDDEMADDEDEFDDDDDFDEDLGAANNWGGVLTTLGAGLVGVVSIQLLGAVVEGMSLKSGERISQSGTVVSDDVLHRLGYTFFNLAPTALLLLLIGISLLAVPAALGLHRGPGHDTISRLALRAAVAVAVLLALGAMLAVRANLHEYAAKDIPVPRWVRLNFTNFLLGTLGTAALAIFGSVATILRDRR